MESPSKSQTEDSNSKEEEVFYKLVPWINWEEWNFVRESLFSSSPDTIATALKRISAWKIRVCLPIVIDVTASIIEIQQKDPEFRKDLNSDALISEGMLAMLYCMAIIRLVNGVVDQDRNKRGKKDKRELSINEAGDEIDLPRKLIDIRHEASHRHLPSLQLVRDASIAALDWIKSYYWEPQKNAIPFQKDKVDFVRTKIKSKLREIAFHLDMKQDSQLGSLPMKRKRNKQSNVIFGRYNHFSNKAKKLPGLQSRGPKNQITRIIRTVFRLYTSFPTEVVAVLLDFLLKALDSSGSNGVEISDDSGVNLISGNSKTQTGIIDICKLVITRLSSKEPELILIILSAVLETLETHETMKSETGRESLSHSQSKAETRQTEQLSSLVLWLIQNYSKLRKDPSWIVCEGEIHDSSSETNVVPKVALAELLRKCLVQSSANSQLARSALLLAQIMGNRSMVDRLKKLPALVSPNMDYAEETSAHIGIEPIFIQQESSISQAAEKLEMLKRLRNKSRATNIVASNDDVKNEGRWTVAKSWNSCAIGMLPGSLGSTGVLPILDRAINLPEAQNVPEGNESWELKRCGGNTYDSHDAYVFEKVDAIEEGTTVEYGLADEHDSLLEPLKGQLMIDGVYKKVSAEELLAIESAVRVLV